MNMLYSRNTYISGNIIKHNLQTSMNKQNTQIYLSHFILERVDVSVVCERWVARHILRERTSSSHIFFEGSKGVPTLIPPCKLIRDASDQLHVPRLTPIHCTLSKSDLSFSWRDPLPVTHLFDLSALMRRHLPVY